jgi:hypothetical protein
MRLPPLCVRRGAKARALPTLHGHIAAQRSLPGEERTAEARARARATGMKECDSDVVSARAGSTVAPGTRG